MKSNFYSLHEQLNNNIYLNKHYLSKNIYYKYLIRTRIKFNYLIDNSYNLHSTIKLPSLKKKKTNILGYSLDLEDYLFSYKGYSKVSFIFPNRQFHQRYKTKSVSKIEDMGSTFKQLLKLKGRKQLRHVIILKPIKSGYSVYTAGVIGFLASHTYKDFLFRFRERFFLQRLIFKSKLTQYTIFWFRFIIIKVTVLYSYKPYKRHTLRNRPRFRLYHPVNIIFFTRRPDRKNDRRYKKFRKYVRAQKLLAKESTYVKN